MSKQPCAYCGAVRDFEREHGRYCSDECRQKDYRAKKKVGNSSKEKAADVQQAAAPDRLPHLNTTEAHFSRIFFALDDLLEVDVTDIDSYEAAYSKLNRRLGDVHAKLMLAKFARTRQEVESRPKRNA
jgi:hypothetical protein